MLAPLRRAKEEHIQKAVKKYGKHLYHYTDFGALKGTLEEKELWFGNTATMNDEKELLHFIGSLRLALYKDVEKERLAECKVFFVRLSERLESEYPFALCLSRLGDDAAQWERYADRGRGVCIKLNTEKLCSLFFRMAVLLQKVHYDLTIRNHEHYKLLLEYFNTGEDAGFADEKGRIDNIILTAACHKHSSFRSEKEVRFIMLFADGPYLKAEYKLISGIIRRVLVVDLGRLCKNENIHFEALFDGIIIGPRSKQNDHDLRCFIESLGFKELAKKTTRSECPLR